MGWIKQILQLILMRKTRTNLYFQKKYCLLIHSVTVHQKLNLAAISTHSAQSEIIERACTYSLNQLVYINCIEAVVDGAPVPDSQPVVRISVWGDKNAKKADIGSVRFDMNLQKIVKPQSPMMFSKEMEDVKGVVNYKFINLKTRTITPEEFDLLKARKGQVELQISKDEKEERIQQLMALLEENRQLINRLKDTELLINENQKLNRELEVSRNYSKGKQFNLKIKVNAGENILKKENQELKFSLAEQNQLIYDLQEKVSLLKQEKQWKDLQLKKTMEKLEKMGDQYKSNSSRKESFIERPRFLNSSIDPVDQLQELPTNLPTRISIRQPKNKKPAVGYDESIVNNKSNVFEKQASQFLKVQKNEQFMKSQSVQKEVQNRLTLSNYNQSPDTRLSQMRRSQVRQSGIKQLRRSMSNEHSDVEQRIKKERQEFKWNSLYYEQKGELDLLKKTVDIYITQNKNTEKELLKCKELLKKKEAEIRELKRASRKNLHFGDALKPIKSRNQFQQQLEKRETEHDAQVITLRDEIERQDKELQQKLNKNKSLTISLEESTNRLKAYEERYGQLRVFNKKLSEDIIQFKEKAGQYDIILIKNRELEAQNKVLTAKNEKAESQAAKFEDLYYKTAGKVKNVQKEMERLRRVQRDHDYYRNQNAVQKKTSDAFEQRFTEIKKFCIKMQDNSKRIVSRKRQSSFLESSHVEQEKQLHQKFVDLYKKVHDFELHYYKQLMQDLKIESQFIAEYYDHKKHQEREKMLELKEMNEKQREQAILAKMTQLQKIRQQKLADIRKRTAALERTYEEAQQKIRQGPQTFLISIPDEMKRIDQKLSALKEKDQIREGQRKVLKETIIQLKDDMVASSGTFSQLKKSKNPSQNQMLKSMIAIAQNRSKKNFLEEARMKNQEAQKKSIEQTKRFNVLMKENHEFKMERDRVKRQAEKAQRAAQEREKKWDEASKKMIFEHKIQVDKLKEQLEKVNEESQFNKIQIAEQHKNVQLLRDELQMVSSQSNQRLYKIGNLYKNIDDLMLTLRQYEAAERKMRQQVDQIKQHAQYNQKEFVVIMETRSQEFVKIQKLKTAEIHNLKQVIKELQESLETQTSQNFTLINQNQMLRSKIEESQLTMSSLQEQSTLQLQNKEAVLDEYYVKWQAEQKMNGILKANLMQLSSTIQSHQIQNAQMNVKIGSLQKQLQIYENKDLQLKKVEEALREEIEMQRNVTEDKIYKIKLYEETFLRVKTEVQLAQKENQRLSNINYSNESLIEQLQQKLSSKADEIIQHKQEKSTLQIQLKKYEFILQKFQFQNQQLQKKIQSLQNQLAKANEAAANVSNLSMVKLAKKPSNMDTSRIQPNLSPNRAARIPRRAQTMEGNDMSSLNFGGITPIIPVSPLAFPKRVESQDQREQTSLLLKKRTSRQIPEDLRSRQNQTLININIEQDQDRSPTNSNKNLPTFPANQSQDAIISTNIGNLLKTNLGEPQYIRQATEQQNQDATQNSGHNKYHFEDKQSAEQNSQNHLIQQLNDKIQALNQQLMLALQENEQLKNQVAQLAQKLQQTAHLGLTHNQKSPISLPAQNALNESQAIRIDSSRKVLGIKDRRSSSFRTSREMVAQQESLNNSKELRQRSQTGAIIPQHKYLELQDKYQSAEIEIQQMQDQIQSLKSQLERQAKDQQTLIEETQSFAEDMDNLNNELKEARFEAQQYKQYQAFEAMYLSERQNVANCMLKIEELTGQILIKEQIIASLNIQSSQAMQRFNEFKAQADKFQSQRFGIEANAKDLQNYIKKMKGEYRKYEQDSELQIVKLHEEVDIVNAKLKEKSQQLQNLGQKYLQQQQQKEQLQNELADVRQYINSKEQQIEKNRQAQGKIEEELSKGEESKQSLYKNIKKMEMQLLQKSDLIRTMLSQNSLSVKKYQIKLQTDQAQMEALSEKISEKQKVIGLLKNQIALYNEQCEQLKKSNDSLSYELVKVEKQLKDILQVYEKQINLLKSQTDMKGKQVFQISKLLKEKQTSINSLAKQLRIVEKERDYAKSETVEQHALLERVKQQKNREQAETHTKLQFSINQCEKLKVSLQKTKEQLDSKQAEIKDLTEKSESRFRVYKDKYEKYQKIIEDFSDELKKIEERPSSQAYQQALFENELLRNQIQELKEQVSKASSKVKQEHIYLQFRKYKANKQRQIQDLQAEMQKYGIKINQLQESLFLMKRENQGLLRSNSHLQEEKEELEAQCQNSKQEIAEIAKELEFYKKRKILDMQKLLNDTQ